MSQDASSASSINTEANKSLTSASAPKSSKPHVRQQSVLTWIASFLKPYKTRVIAAIVFLFIGLTPVGFKAFNNYTLEISSPDQHPRYLSTLGLCYAVPLLFSPILGWVVSVIGFDRVFIVVSLVVFAGGLLTFRLHEPRLVS